MKLELTYGSDPELMLWDTQNKRIVSAIPILKKDKHDPINLGDGIKMYADNVLVETAFSPVKSSDDMLTKLRTVFGRMQEKLGNRYHLLPQAAHVYDKDQLEDPSCWESGCNPNYDAYDRKVNLPADFRDGLRTGSFHIHIGSDKLKEISAKERCIKLLDVYVGTASILFDRDETAAKRKKLYGKAGEFRPTAYGCEWRVLGNYALRSPETTKLVFDLVDLAMVHVAEGTEDDLLKLVNPNDVRHAINDSDKKMASAILKKIELPSAFMNRINKQSTPDFYRDWRL